MDNGGEEGFPDVEGEGVDIWVMYRLKEDQFVTKKWFRIFETRQREEGSIGWHFISL